jgi:polysaccharide pyruvyl transferase WcaK-like protein
LVWGRSDDAFLARFEAIAIALALKGWELVFFPVWDDDVTHCVKMAEAVKAARGKASVEMIRKPDAFVKRMESVDVFIGEKLHAVILAACALTPSIMMEYRPKCRDFMASMGLDEDCRRIDEVTPDWIFSRIDAALKNEDALRRAMFERAQIFKARMRAAADTIIESLG